MKNILNGSKNFKKYYIMYIIVGLSKFESKTFYTIYVIITDQFCSMFIHRKSEDVKVPFYDTYILITAIAIYKAHFSYLIRVRNKVRWLEFRLITNQAPMRINTIFYT